MGSWAGLGSNGNLFDWLMGERLVRINDKFLADVSMAWLSIWLREERILG